MITVPAAHTIRTAGGSFYELWQSVKDDSVNHVFTNGSRFEDVIERYEFDITDDSTPTRFRMDGRVMKTLMHG